MSEKGEARTQELMATIADGIAKLTTTGDWTKFLKWQSKFHRYSFGNVMLILAQCPTASLIMGYGAKPVGNAKSASGWLSVGRKVRKGERAIWILAPMIGKDKKDETKTFLYGFRSVPVFDISQTDGEPIPSPAKLLKGEAPSGMLDAMINVIKGFGFAVEFGTQSGPNGPNGETNYTTKTVTIQSDRDALQQFKTAIHECGHVVLHGPDNEKTREIVSSLREFEAESVAFVVANYLGVDTGVYSFGYLATWTNGGDKDTVAKAIKVTGQHVQRAAKKIIDALEETER